MISDWYNPSRSVEENNAAYLTFMEEAPARGLEILSEDVWAEFFALLEGPAGCDFKKDDNDQITWTCAGGNDKTFATKILENMGIDKESINEALQLVHSLGGHCDCEILFNAEERILL